MNVYTSNWGRHRVKVADTGFADIDALHAHLEASYRDGRRVEEVTVNDDLFTDLVLAAEVARREIEMQNKLRQILDNAASQIIDLLTDHLKGALGR